MNKLNNRHSQNQSEPLKIQDKEITDDKKIANCFNSYFSGAHKLINNLKKQGKLLKETPRHLQTTTLRKSFT
jgi:hypothetical protein